MHTLRDHYKSQKFKLDTESTVLNFFSFFFKYRWLLCSQRTYLLKGNRLPRYMNCEWILCNVKCLFVEIEALESPVVAMVVWRLRLHAYEQCIWRHLLRNNQRISHITDKWLSWIPNKYHWGLQQSYRVCWRIYGIWEIRLWLIAQSAIQNKDSQSNMCSYLSWLSSLLFFFLFFSSVNRRLQYGVILLIYWTYVCIYGIWQFKLDGERQWRLYTVIWINISNEVSNRIERITSILIVIH